MIKGYSPYQQDDYLQKVLQMMQMRRMMQAMDGREPPGPEQGGQRPAGMEAGVGNMGPGMEAGIGATEPTNPEELSWLEKLKAFLRS